MKPYFNPTGDTSRDLQALLRQIQSDTTLLKPLVKPAEAPAYQEAQPTYTGPPASKPFLRRNHFLNFKYDPKNPDTD
jgi:hypothetical protein